MPELPIRKQILQELQSISPLDALEAEHKVDAEDWLRTSVNIFRIQAPDKPPKHLVAYFVVVDPEQRKVLLGDHIKAQLWLPTGGHVALNEHPRQTVMREAEEELSMHAIFLRDQQQPFFVTVTDTVGLTAGHTDVSLWYVLRGESYKLPRFERREFTDMNWFGTEEILVSHPSIFDPHMQRFTRKLVNYLDQA